MNAAVSDRVLAPAGVLRCVRERWRGPASLCAPEPGAASAVHTSGDPPAAHTLGCLPWGTAMSQGGSGQGVLAQGVSAQGVSAGATGASLDLPLLDGRAEPVATRGGGPADADDSLACADRLLSDRPAQCGQSGALHWRDDGAWLWGWLDLADDGPAGEGVGAGEGGAGGGKLAQATCSAYGQLFTLLRERGYRHLLRLWNYLPRINDTGTALERYREFNIGRLQAFEAAGHDAMAGAPAACALGTQGRTLALRFLAGRQPALALENPRQVPAWRYSRAWGPRSPSFSRAALVDAGAGQLALFISGTAAIVGEQSQHAGDLLAQLDETLRNLQAVLDVAHARSSARFALDRLSLTVYLRHAADARRVHAALQRALGTQADWVLLQADVCRRELLIEIEAHGMAPGSWT